MQVWQAIDLSVPLASHCMAFGYWPGRYGLRHYGGTRIDCAALRSVTSILLQLDLLVYS